LATRGKHDIAFIVAIVLCALIFASLRTEFRLKSDMPVLFFDPSHLPPAKRAAEETIARAYWNCAVNEIQWRYAYGSRLPEEPPREFVISVQQAGAAARDDAMRHLAWQSLRQVWNDSDVWNTHYELSFVSLRTAFHSAGDWWENTFRHIIGR